jgi:hypothetical protein
MFRGALLFVTFGALSVGKWCFLFFSFFNKEMTAESICHGAWHKIMYARA